MKVEIRGSQTERDEGSNFVGCDTVLLGVLFLTFRTIMVPPPSWSISPPQDFGSETLTAQGLGLPKTI